MWILGLKGLNPEGDQFGRGSGVFDPQQRPYTNTYYDFVKLLKLC